MVPGPSAGALDNPRDFGGTLGSWYAADAPLSQRVMTVLFGCPEQLLTNGTGVTLRR